jgi:hypothetical protein
MKWFQVGAVIGSVFVSGQALGQDASQIANGWRKVEGASPAYVNAATLVRCPESLGDGYRLFRADVYTSSTNVSCGYRLGTSPALISFYFYPSQGSVNEEVTSTSRPVLTRLAPGTTPTQIQREWKFEGASVSVAALEVLGTDGLGQSFAIADIAGKRMKARETWEGSSEVSHRVADSFFALQRDAIANAQACAALPSWPTGRKARLSNDPLTAAMTAGFIIGSLMPAAKVDSTQPASKPCVLASLGRSDRGSNLLLTRSGPTGTQLALDDQPEENLLAGLASVEVGAALSLPGDARYALYSREGTSSAVYRAYRTLPNWEQIRADMVLVATNALAPMVTIQPKAGEEGSNISINAEETAKEKRKQRPGSQ